MHVYVCTRECKHMCLRERGRQIWVSMIHYEYLLFKFGIIHIFMVIRLFISCVVVFPYSFSFVFSNCFDTYYHPSSVYTRRFQSTSNFFLGTERREYLLKESLTASKLRHKSRQKTSIDWQKWHRKLCSLHSHKLTNQCL